jgi:hypothetical protein
MPLFTAISFLIAASSVFKRVFMAVDDLSLVNSLVCLLLINFTSSLGFYSLAIAAGPFSIIISSRVGGMES